MQTYWKFDKCQGLVQQELKYYQQCKFTFFTILTIFGFQFKFQLIINSIARLPFKEFDTTFIVMENYKI